MSDLIRRLIGPTLPNSEWQGSSMPHKAPQQTYITDLDMPGVMVDGVPPISPGGAPGEGTGRPLFDIPSDGLFNPQRGGRGVFRDPASYDNRT